MQKAIRGQNAPGLALRSAGVKGNRVRWWKVRRNRACSRTQNECAEQDGNFSIIFRHFDITALREIKMAFVCRSARASLCRLQSGIYREGIFQRIALAQTRAAISGLHLMHARSRAARRCLAMR
jgi:hypothetical protein